MEDIELAFIISSAFATVMAFSVILTAIIFPEMRTRLFIQVIICISLSDSIASAASAFGFPGKDSILCPIQAFAIFFFYKASWLWTTVLSYQLYSICLFGKFGLSNLQMHAICWSISALTTFLPLSTNRFGRDDDSDLAWCTYHGPHASSVLWVVLSFDAVLVVCFLLIMFFLFRIYWKYRLLNLSKYPEVSTILDALAPYPPGFLLTWGPNLVFSFLINFDVLNNTKQVAQIFNAVSILATQSGTVLAIIFFVKSKEARYRWGRLVAPWLTCCGHHGSRTAGGSTAHTHDMPDNIPLDFGDDEHLARKVTESGIIDSSRMYSDDFSINLPRVGESTASRGSMDSGIGYDTQNQLHVNMGVGVAIGSPRRDDTLSKDSNATDDGLGWSRYSQSPVSQQWKITPGSPGR